MENTQSYGTIEILKKHEEYILKQINKTKNINAIKNLEIHLDLIREKIKEKQTRDEKRENVKKQVLITKAEDAGALLKSAS